MPRKKAPEITFQSVVRSHCAMEDSDRRVLETFAARVRERFPAARVWAFGSRARGEGEWGQ